MASRNEDTLGNLTAFLTERFQHWEYLYENGGSDPFHSDGVNLNLVRNHIISTKLRIKQFFEQQEAEISFFSSEYPDIYFRETPPEVPQNFMAKADEIRARAQEQLALYESDPNFIYILNHHNEVFKNGETKATKKAGLSIYKTGGLSCYRRVIEEDHLVYMRSYFSEPYEEKAVRWAEQAKALKEFLSADHSNDDITPIKEFDHDSDYDGNDYEEHVTAAPVLKKKPSLNEQIKRASESTPKSSNSTVKEEQMSLF